MSAYVELFGPYVCLGDTIEFEIDGREYVAALVFDDSASIDDDDMHNPDQSVTGCDDEQQARLLAARQAWFDDEWHYYGVVVTRLCECCGQPDPDHQASLWGIEGNYPGAEWACGLHMTRTAIELAGEIT